MAEWSIASVLKTDIRKRIRGSNPFLSAFYNISAGTVDYTGGEEVSANLLKGRSSAKPEACESLAHG